LGNLRFQLDEHMDHAIARGLRRRGIDVITTSEAGLLGSSDTTQLAHAHSTGRIMVTQDRDYIDLHYASVPHSGIVFCGQSTRSVGDVIEILIIINEAFEPSDLLGKLERV
jgi:predicted nuclease of predicted toxin-antitoxin system